MVEIVTFFERLKHASFVNDRFILQPVDTIKKNIGDKVKANDEKIKTIQVSHSCRNHLFGEVLNRLFTSTGKSSCSQIRLAIFHACTNLFCLTKE